MTVELLAVLCTAITAALLCRIVAPPPPRLAALIHVTPGGAAPAQGGTGALGRLLAPHAGAWSGGAGLERRLRQAGMLRGREASAAALDHLARTVARGGVQGVAIGCALLAAGARGPAVAAGFLLGAVAGAARQHASVDQVIQERRERIPVELCTVNQLLALDVRAGGGVAQALERVVRRGQGVVAEELRDVLATARAGLALHEALEQAAQFTPEPAAARTYRLLAKGARYGTDLATGLRALNEDLRVQRAEAIERAATKRRAAMLLPIIGLLAPVMLLFIAAPLPSIVFGMR